MVGVAGELELFDADVSLRWKVSNVDFTLSWEVLAEVVGVEGELELFDADVTLRWKVSNVDFTLSWEVLAEVVDTLR